MEADRVLEQVSREAGDRIRAALAIRFRDLDLAEEAFAHASLRAVETWGRDGAPRDPAAWLFAVARRHAFDLGRRAKVRETVASWNIAVPETDPTDLILAKFEPIPDERLRLIFVCCHPALAPESRIGLTLSTLCGLTAARIARAFLISESAVVQRLTRAKRKIRETRVRFEIPEPNAWAERLQTVLATLEIAYAQAYEDAAGTSDVADLAQESLRLSGLLAQMLPDEPEVLGLAALVRLAESRRPARLALDGAMIPLDQQDARLWDSALIAQGAEFLRRAALIGRSGPYQLMAAIHAVHADRGTAGVTRWADIVSLYDALLLARPSQITLVNRAVAVGQLEGALRGLAALESAAGSEPPGNWLPYFAALAGLSANAGQMDAAALALRRALALGPAHAERLYLENRLRATGR